MTDIKDTPVAHKYKVCQKCKTDKLLSEFGLNTKRKDGYQAWCRQGVNSYYKKNRDKAIKRSKEWYIENIDHKKRMTKNIGKLIFLRLGKGKNRLTRIIKKKQLNIERKIRKKFQHGKNRIITQTKSVLLLIEKKTANAEQIIIENIGHPIL